MLIPAILLVTCFLCFPRATVAVLGLALLSDPKRATNLTGRLM